MDSRKVFHYKKYSFELVKDSVSKKAGEFF
ncbi:MAG: hypothetical protein ACI93S_001769 [Ancylomarina sp.]|jgi:hypothetical protein